MYSSILCCTENLKKTPCIASIQVLEQLEEEELMEECLEAMLEEERQHHRNQTTTAWCNAANSPENNGADLCQQLNGLKVQGDIAKQVKITFRNIKSNPTKLHRPIKKVYCAGVETRILIAYIRIHIHKNSNVF